MMKKNKSSIEAQTTTLGGGRACQKLGDGGTYIGGGRLFKKSTNNDTPAQSADVTPSQDFEVVDKKDNDSMQVENFATPTFKDEPAKSIEKGKESKTAENSSNSDVSDEAVEQKQPTIVPYGDYHTHTVFSDGTGTLEENIQHAISIGLKEYAVTDHAFRHKAHGITLANFQVQKRMVELYREKYPQIKIYHALEGNLMGYSGLLDTDAYVNDLDFLQMGYHKTASNESFATWWSFTAMNFIFKPSKAKIEKNTLAYLRCIDRYPLKFVNHLNYGVLVNCKEIAKLCVERGTCIELNGKRVFFSQSEVDDMLETGVNFVVNSDAHASERVGDVSLPLEFAKTHGIPFERIINLNDSIIK